jgi:hypothetical protein
MRVLCINAGELPGDVQNQPKLTEGVIYTVKEAVTGFTFKGWEGPCYELVEFSSTFAFQQERFIPLSDINEKAVFLGKVASQKVQL